MEKLVMVSNWILPLGLLGGWFIFAGKRRQEEPTDIEVELGDAIIHERRPELDDMIQLATEDLERWSTLSEGDKEDSIAMYWDASGRAMSDEPWSGAWIVWLANSVLPGSLPRVPGHAAYAHAQLTNTSPNEFTTLPPSTPVEIGDIILKPRSGESREFEELASGEFFPSHGDFVVDIRDGKVITVGGNKAGKVVGGDSYTLNPDGTAQGIFAVLRLGAVSENA